jgi:hypothetical protein
MLKLSSDLTSFLRQVWRKAEEDTPEYEAAGILLAGSLARTSGEKREEIARRCEKGDFSSVDVPDTLLDELKIIAEALRTFQNDPAKRGVHRRKHHEG